MQKDRLPLFDSGLLSDLVYANEPAIVEDLQERIRPDDPAAEYYRGMNFLLAVPLFDTGQALNMNILLCRDGERFPRQRIPTIVWQANLWGRSVLSSVLREELKVAYDALDHEFKMVADIQRSLLPAKLPEIPGVDMAAYYQTSQRAGGDYYDFFPMSDDQWGIFIADVSGHGIAAAVMMAITHAIAHTRPGDAMPPGEMLAYLNKTLESRYTGHGVTFVTAFYGVYDPKTRRLAYASAGHPRPRLARNGKVCELDGLAGLPLGIDVPEDYPEHVQTLKAGDRLLFYTDGVSDASNARHEPFDIGGLDKALLRHSASAQELIDAILADINRHCGNVPAEDDRTLLAICLC
jgi:sigma-B regulation protein RsbU (phosphoserine phosphatase)